MEGVARRGNSRRVFGAVDFWAESYRVSSGYSIKRKKHREMTGKTRSQEKARQ